MALRTLGLSTRATVNRILVSLLSISVSRHTFMAWTCPSVWNDMKAGAATTARCKVDAGASLLPCGLLRLLAATLDLTMSKHRFSHFNRDVPYPQRFSVRKGRPLPGPYV
ncbi:hypothetical protein BJV78DRAFT_782045 [Lactifluus subvellereus]|nr:hypothetical protein BJV78DRAFT_782045 [Lactifluus subvellereus]